MAQVYVVKSFINGSLCLFQPYKRKQNAIKEMEKRIKSNCYDRVQLVLQNPVFFADNVLILKEWTV